MAFYFKNFKEKIREKLPPSFTCKGGGSNFIWIESAKFIATLGHHYEFNAEKKEKAGHNGNIFVEIHSEGKNSIPLSEILGDTLNRFKWLSEPGFRINNQGYEMVGDVNEVADKAINELMELDNLVGDKIKKYIKEMETKEKVEQYAEVLRHNHNLILTGAPGTGKTYLAKEIAKAMGCSENEIGFVQFHPSYDYTDFVEGLRPKDDSGNIGFEHKDGVFKEFCTRALKNNTVTNNFDDVFDTFLNDIRDNENFLELNTPSGSKFYVSVNQRRNLTFYTGQENKVGGSLTRKGVKTEYEGKPFYKYWLGYYNGVINYMKAKYNLHSVTEDKKKNFVFIIDEINRGEISKIFGELFFTIDPGYRGEVGKVRTQYANMQTEPNDFDDALGVNEPDNCGHFFIPENVYIIGTMNDIDRSVESMDFAFRRRFAFKEVTAEESQEMLDSVEAWGQDENENSLKPDDKIVDDIKEKMNNLNKVIWHKPIDGESDEDKSIEGLSSAYHIGASYFLKLNNYKNVDGSFDFDKLWEYHLEGLLFEYLRGTTEMSKKLKKLAMAYGYTKADKYE